MPEPRDEDSGPDEISRRIARFFAGFGAAFFFLFSFEAVDLRDEAFFFFVDFFFEADFFFGMVPSL